MKEIKLGQHRKGKYSHLVAVVDDDMFDYLNQWKWYAHREGNTFYAARNEPLGKHKQTTVRMHNVIMNTPNGARVDHINRNGLCNLKSNMRNCTASENKINSGMQKNNTSGAKGVSWSVNYSKWVAQICINGKHKLIGSFANKADAILAYNTAAQKYHGEFANLNQI